MLRKTRIYTSYKTNLHTLVNAKYRLKTARYDAYKSHLACKYDRTLHANITTIHP